MIDQGATEAELDAYLASEGTTVQDLLPGLQMTPQDEAAYVVLAQDPKSTAADLQRLAQARGLAITAEDADALIRQRAAAAGQVSPAVQYREATEDQRVLSSPSKDIPNVWLEPLSATAIKSVVGVPSCLAAGV